MELTLICQNNVSTLDESTKYIITFVSSLVVAFSIFFSTIYKDKRKAKEEATERLRREIYFLCEKLLSHAIYASKRALEARYYYAMHKIDRDEDFDKSNYSKYHNDSENAILSADLCTVELKSKVKELEFLSGPTNELKQIDSLLYEAGHPPINRYDGIFSGEMTKDNIQRIRDTEMRKIVSYTREVSVGKNLVAVQKIIYPNSKMKV